MFSPKFKFYFSRKFRKWRLRQLGLEKSIYYAVKRCRMIVPRTIINPRILNRKKSYVTHNSNLNCVKL